MIDEQRYRSASDKDVFDLLMSTKGRMSEKTLLSIALKRGILYSRKTTRERIASDISFLQHDYNSLKDMIEKREAHTRSEKRTFVILPVALSREEIKTIVDEYRTEVKGREEVSFQPRRSSNAYVNVAYEDIDYSKTHLIQR